MKINSKRIIKLSITCIMLMSIMLAAAIFITYQTAPQASPALSSNDVANASFKIATTDNIPGVTPPPYTSHHGLSQFFANNSFWIIPVLCVIILGLMIAVIILAVKVSEYKQH